MKTTLQDELLAICRATEQTVFMITHDIDEAVRLADRIILMSNGPFAKIREIVVNTLPIERTRNELHKHPSYYPLRNHLLEFLVTRSAEVEEELTAMEYDPRRPPLVYPGAEGTGDATGDAARGAGGVAETEARARLAV